MQFECFTLADVEQLKDNPSEHTKIELIQKLHHNFKLDKLEQTEKLIAEEILRHLAADISVKIRKSISANFCDNLALPRDIALRLANDMEDIVALPIIENSNVLEDEDLLEIIKNSKVERKHAVARRSNMSDNLCAHIIYEAPAEVIDTLIRNNKIGLSETTCEILIQSQGDNPVLMRSLIQNKKVTSEQAHNLLTRVSEDLRNMLIVHYNIPSTTVNNLIHDSKEWILLNIIRAHNDSNPKSLPLITAIEKLQAEGELSFSILVKSLSLGNLAFFEAGISRMAGIPVDSVQRLLWEQEDSRGFNALYIKCGLPESMSEAIYKLLHIIRDEKNSANNATKVHHRILNRLSRTSVMENVNNLDYLVTIVAYNLKKSNLL